MDIIEERDLRTAFPDDLRYFDRLTERQRRNYLILATAYRRLINAYAAFVGLGRHDRALGRGGLRLEPVAERDQDLYQRFAGAGLRYYYVRNNVYVERLTADGLGFLRERVREGALDHGFDLDAYRFVGDTLARVLREQWVSTDAEGRASWSSADAEVNFGPDEDRFFCPNGALVVGCRVAGRPSPDALEGLLRQNDLLQRELADRVPVPLSVVLYDEASVRPLP